MFYILFIYGDKLHIPEIFSKAEIYIFKQRTRKNKNYSYDKNKNEI